MQLINIDNKELFMHFEHLSELKIFVKEEVFPDCKEISEIKTGGSSYNFKIHTAQNVLFLKLLDNEQRYLRLQTILERMQFVCPLPTTRFLQYFMLVMPYVEGKTINYADMNDEMVQNWLQQLRNLQTMEFPSAVIAPQQNIKDLFHKTQQLLETDDMPFTRMVKLFFWPRFKSGLIAPAITHNIIHGDMIPNNIMVRDNKPVLLDFEALRYGYAIEDVASLVLQLCGFRNLNGGSLSKFIKLYKQVQNIMPINNALWLYGVQMFYFNRLLRRLQNGDAQKRNWRRGLCFLISVYGYFRIEKFFRRAIKPRRKHGLLFWCKFALYKVRKLIRIIPHNRHL